MVHLNLTINNSSTSSSIITTCNSFDWNGQTYTSSGTYTWTGTNSVADVIVSLNLTINSSDTTSSYVTSLKIVGHGMELRTCLWSLH